MFTTFTIYGERCTGTNFVRKLMADNFDLDNVCLPQRDDIGWKHFFGSLVNKYAIKDSRNCVVLSIVRNPIDTLVSFFNTPHHQPAERTKDFLTFLTSEFYSIKPDGSELLLDRNFQKGGLVRYKDIFEMRSVKNRFLFSTIPTLTPNSYFMRYEDLKTRPQEVLGEIAKKFDLTPKHTPFVVEQRRIRPQARSWTEFDFGEDAPKENYPIEDSKVKEAIKSRLIFETEELVGYSKESILRRLE